MRIFLFLAVVANSLDLVLTTFGIHWPGLGNREGNPLLAPMVQHQWMLFVIVRARSFLLIVGSTAAPGAGPVQLGDGDRDRGAGGRARAVAGLDRRRLACREPHPSVGPHSL